MKYQIQKEAADIGLKVIFASVEGVNNFGRNPEWETERKEKLEKLRRRYEGLEIHKDAILEGYHILHDKSGVKRKKNIPSSENLIKMLLKHGDLPFINQVVDILYIIEGNEATEDAFLSKVMQEIIDTTVRYCGGSGNVFSPDILL